MYKAGQALATLVGGDPKNRLVWFAVQRAFPARFQTKDLDTGSWIPLKAATRTMRKNTPVANHGSDAVASATTTKDFTPALATASIVISRSTPTPKKAATAKATKNVKITTQKKSSGKKAKPASGSSRNRRIA
jgi:hypothetical protein